MDSGTHAWSGSNGSHSAYRRLRARIEIRIKSATTATHTAMTTPTVLLASTTTSAIIVVAMGLIGGHPFR